MAKSHKSLIRIVAMVFVLTVAKLTGVLDKIGNDSGPDTGSSNSSSSAPASPPSSPRSQTTANAGSAEVEAAYEAERSGVMLSLSGVVKKILPDDNDGSRHQKFIVRMPNKRTVLIAHNIDLADRVPLSEGDDVSIHGQYEWNGQGGIVHWTHKDPDGRHAEGYIDHAGKRYE